MKKPTNGWLSAVCVISIRARFTTVVATGLWPVHILAAFHAQGTDHRAVATAVAASDLPAGSAKGSLTYDGATAELKFAAAFVDQKDERKPIVLVISDQKLPVERLSHFLILTSAFPWHFTLRSNNFSVR
jgi:hypothetical protein